MNSTVATPLVQPVKKQKNMLFIVPAVMAIIYSLLYLFSVFLNFASFFEETYEERYGNYVDSRIAFDSYEVYQSVKTISYFADFLFAVLFLLFVIACIKKAFGAKHKTFTIIFYAQALFAQPFWFVWNLITNSAWVKFTDNIYGDYDWYEPYDIYGEDFWKDIFIRYIPLIIWYALLIVSEKKDIKALRIFTIIPGFFALVGTFLNYINIYFTDIENFFSGFSNNPQGALSGLLVVFICTFTLGLQYLAIMFYQAFSLIKPKQKDNVVDNSTSTQPVNRPTPPVRPVQPVRPIVPVQPVYQPVQLVYPVQPVVPTPVAESTPKATNTPNQSAEERLVALKRLFDDNIITQEEFDKKREEILKDF